MTIEITRRRTGWDVLFGLLLVVAGFIILGDTVLATIVSVRFLGWAALVIGIAELIGALFRLRAGHVWSAVLGGALLTVLGVLILRNTLAAALTLTLAAAALFLSSGVIRIGMAFAVREHRWGLLISGIASAVLGVIVLFNIVTATFTLLGVLLGVQTLIEGLTLAFLGRPQAQGVPPAGAPASASETGAASPR